MVAILGFSTTVTAEQVGHRLLKVVNGGYIRVRYNSRLILVLSDFRL